MPGKSKHKKYRYSSSNSQKSVQATASTAGTSQTRTGTPVDSKPQSASVKSASSATRVAPAQYTPDQFNYVSTELKVAGTLSAVLLVVIVALYFVFR